MHKNTLIHKDKPRVDTTEKHLLSLCDIRHPLAVKLEKQIESVAKQYHRGIHRAKQDRYRLLARLPYQEQWSSIQEQEVSLLTEVIRDLRLRCHRELGQLYRTLRDVSLVKQFEVNNIIPTAGRAVIAQWITGDNTYDADTGANYGSLGTSSTAPANGDTQLTAESYRKATSSVATASNVAYLSNFYTASEVTGTFEEAGWHIDGTASANTGQLLSHFLTGTVTKAATETLTVESTLTIS